MAADESIAVASDRFPVSVVTAREPVSDHPWISQRWRVLGVVAGATRAGPRRVIRSAADGEQYLWPGFVLRLYPSEADSYYLNLVSATPRVYVVCQLDDDGQPVPVETSVEYVEAGARREGGDEVYAVPMPAEVGQWLERFVLEHYVPQEPKMKRKHGQWGKGAGPRANEPND